MLYIEYRGILRSVNFGLLQGGSEMPGRLVVQQEKGGSYLVQVLPRLPAPAQAKVACDESGMISMVRPMERVPTYGEIAAMIETMQK